MPPVATEPTPPIEVANNIEPLGASFVMYAPASPCAWGRPLARPFIVGQLKVIPERGYAQRLST